MDDVEFDRSHSNSPLPEAGNDPGDPLSPGAEQSNAPLAEPTLDMDVAESHPDMPDQADVEEAGLSDNESVLSELDERQFDDFDPVQLSIEDRPQIIDENNVGLIGVHKRKRDADDGGDSSKKRKKKKRDNRREKTSKTSKKKDGHSGGSGNEEGGRPRRTRASRRVRDERRSSSPMEQLTERQSTSSTAICHSTDPA